MNSYKKILIIMLILIVFIILIISTILIINRNRTDYEENKGEVENIVYVNEEVEFVKDYTNYYTVIDCINVLNDAIENNKLILPNIVKNNYELDSIITEVKHMYQAKKNTNNTYYIECNDKNNNDVYLVMYQDPQNKTFEFEIIKNNEYNDIITGNKEKKLNENIEKNNYNVYKEVFKSEEEIVSLYAQNYIELLKNNVNKAFEILDSDYKEMRFNNNIDEFKDYLNNNQSKIEKSVMTEFGSNIVIKDGNASTVYYYRNNNNYNFIIKEKAVMEYTILLDDYTIKDSTYDENYNKLNTSAKIQNNVNIFFNCINEKNYTGAYNLLDKQFKQNNFNTQNEFEEYVVNNFFNNNILGNINIEESSGKIYICTCMYRDSVSSNAQKATKKIFMQLNEGTDFVMSFNIE